ncbi:MAG: helix-turn-helix transcriptional regulator [Caulobacteraceae bacterium]|nr:helix-turn-helix transcriptional regulator [Caulobacteraceae bacterium]
MLKLEVDGAEVKRLRSRRERSATQKEFAHEVGISERRLREIENAKGLIAVDVVDRLARALSVPRTQLCASALAGLGNAVKTSRGGIASFRALTPASPKWSRMRPC